MNWGLFRLRCDKYHKAAGCWSDFDLVGKQKWFKSDASSYRKPEKGMQQWGEAGELGEVENKS